MMAKLLKPSDEIERWRAKGIPRLSLFSRPFPVGKGLVNGWTRTQSVGLAVTPPSASSPVRAPPPCPPVGTALSDYV